MPAEILDIPAADYHAIEALSSSGMRLLELSPAHFRAGWREATEAMEFGTAAHACLLQPGEFADSYVCGPSGDKRTKAVKDAWASCEAANPGKIIVRGEDWPALEGIRRAVWEHPAARRLLLDVAETEASIIWDDPAGPAKCKSRLDAVTSTDRLVLDLKIVTQVGDARPERFARKINEFRYDRQAAMYRRALLAAGQSWGGHVWIVVESPPPHGVMVYAASDYDIMEADHEIDRLIETYARCVQSGEWPAYPAGVVTLSRPDWARRER